MKTTTARRNYTCYVCKEPIEKGSTYSKRSMSIGSPSKETTEKIDGIVYHVNQGIRVDRKMHSNCNGGNE